MPRILAMMYIYGLMVDSKVQKPFHNKESAQSVKVNEIRRLSLYRVIVLMVPVPDNAKTFS